MQESLLPPYNFQTQQALCIDNPISFTRCITWTIASFCIAGIYRKVDSGRSTACTDSIVHTQEDIPLTQ